MKRLINSLLFCGVVVLIVIFSLTSLITLLFYVVFEILYNSSYKILDVTNEYAEKLHGENLHG